MSPCRAHKKDRHSSKMARADLVIEYAVYCYTGCLANSLDVTFCCTLQSLESIQHIHCLIHANQAC